MLQVQYSASGQQSVVFWTDTQTTASSILIDFIDDIRGTTSSVGGTIASNKVLANYGGWILAEINNAEVPTNSGQYTADIYPADTLVPTWANTTKTWAQIVQSWADYSSEFSKVGNSLSTDRALVSGSDYDTINVYEFQDNSNFTVYNG